MDENLYDWIYGCMGSAVADFNFKFLREEALATTLAIGATYGWLYKISLILLHIPSYSSRSHPFLMMFRDVSGYSSAEIILRDILFSDFRVTNRWRIARFKISGYGVDGWSEGSIG
jgi:hypothetical protein